MKINIEGLKEKLTSDINDCVSWLSLKKILYIIISIILLIILLVKRTNLFLYYNKSAVFLKKELENLDDINTIGFAFWFSTSLLIVISLIKYFMINIGSLKKDFGEFIMELPIDICTVVITILASIYLSQHTGKGITLIIITVGVITICSIFRRLSIKRGGLEKFSILSAVFGIVDIALAMFWISQVLNIISQ